MTETIIAAKLTAKRLGDEDSNSTLACIALRLLLEFEPSRQDAIATENELVQGHMRVVYSVPAHREYLRAGAPSEPILAEAAACIMNEKISSLPQTVSRYMANGLISKGERGELVARLLLTLAHDRALYPNLDLTVVLKHESAPFSQPIPVLDFLKTLLGEENMKQILESKASAGPKDATFETTFANAAVRFTHFAKGGDSAVVTDVAAYVAMCRGIAWQCYDRQADIDMIIPVILNPNKPIDRYNMSAIFIQIKNRTKKQANYIDAEALGFFSKKKRQDVVRPYITLTMHLGVQSQRSKNKPGTEQIPEPPSGIKLGPQGTAGERPKRSAQPPRKAIHSQFSIFVTGCSAKVYNVINRNEETTYAQLLIARSLINEHPRQDGQYLAAIRRLKPAWEAGESFESSGLSWHEKAKEWTTADDVKLLEWDDDDDNAVGEEGVSMIAPDGDEVEDEDEDEDV